jgi:hypothetical protein
VSSLHGSIGGLLLTVPRYATEPPYPPAYQRLLASLPAEIDLVVLTQGDDGSVVRSWLAATGHDRRARVLVAEDDLFFSVWAEDGYVCAIDRTSGETFLIEPVEFPRYGDALIADYVAYGTELRTSQAPVYFHGGNILVGDAFFLIGIDYPERTLDLESLSLPDLPRAPLMDYVRDLYRRYLDPQRELHFVGSRRPAHPHRLRIFDLEDEPRAEEIGAAGGIHQPIFHIDMLVSLAGRSDAGRYRVLVGDPRLAVALVDDPSFPLPAHAMAVQCDQVAAGLEARGFEVTRNPLPLVYADDDGELAWSAGELESRYGNVEGASEVIDFMAEREMDRIPLRRWYVATSNNVLAERTDDRGIVWMPEYAVTPWEILAPVDAANRALWERLGFEVRGLGDFHAFAEDFGAAHCITKYLGRR